MFEIPSVARVVAVVAALTLLAAACGSDSSSGDSGAAAVTDAGTASTVPASDDGLEPSSDGAEEATPEVEPETTVDSESDSADAQILSAYLAVVDTANPAGFSGLSGCAGEVGDDAMPVVFSVQIDESTLGTDDFSVETASGMRYTPTCATLSPADEADEGYTVLLTGPLGDSADRPVSVSIVGELTGRDGADLSMLEAPPITDGPGPSLVLAIETDAGSECAALGSEVEIQTVWQASVSESDQTAAAISLVSADGEANPVGVDDPDVDNHLVLCVPAGHDTIRVDVEAGAVSGGTGSPNPESSVEL